jgi:hypothetical protein
VNSQDFPQVAGIESTPTLTQQLTQPKLGAAAMSSLRTALVALVTVVTLFSFSAPAASRPGGGGMVMGTARGVGRGGLAIDYSRAQKSTPSTMTAEWKDGILAATVGTREHRVKLSDWEMRDLLRISLDTAANGLVEVSVDRVAGGRNFYASPPLMIGSTVSPIGDWLQQADLEFAEVASMGTSTKEETLRSLAPGAHAQRLLETDAGYQKLARDVVIPIVPWPMIVFDVGSLSEAAPVTWQPTFRPQFITPDGQALEPEPSHPWIEPEMAEQALRPYEALTKAIRSSSPEGRRLLRKHFPLVAAAERYALGLTILEVHCARQASKCREWQRSLSDASADVAPQAAADSQVDLLNLFATWDSVRIELALREPDDGNRCWIFVDEAVFSLHNGRLRYTLDAVLAILPKRSCDRGDAGPWVKLLVPAIKLLAEVSAREPRASAASAELKALETAIQKVPKSSRLSSEEKGLWKDRAAFALWTIQPWTSTMPDQQREIDSLFAKVRSGCVDGLGAEARRARKSPFSESALQWRKSLARLERCPWYPVMDRVLTGASFHFAIGMNESKLSGADAAMHSKDRLRMLQSHVAFAAAKSPLDAPLIDKLAAKLASRIYE